MTNITAQTSSERNYRGEGEEAIDDKIYCKVIYGQNNSVLIDFFFFFVIC